MKKTIRYKDVAFESLESRYLLVSNFVYDNEIVSDFLTQPQRFAVADINEDQLPDLLIATKTDLRWFVRQNDQSFARSEPLTSETILSVEVVDMDGDGDLDTVTGAQGEVFWYENIEGNPLGNRHHVGWIMPRDIAPTIHVSDLDNNGTHDLIVSSHQSGVMELYENDGSGDFEHVTNLADDEFAFSIMTADIDGDDDLDIVSGSFKWYANVGGNRFAAARTIGFLPASTGISLTDVDQDGDVDVVSASRFDAEVVWFSNQDGQGGFAIKQRIGRILNDIRIARVTVSDIDQDGLEDVIVISDGSGDRAEDNGRVVWYRNEGGGSFSDEKPIDLKVDDASWVVATDYDGDSFVDVIYSDDHDNAIVWARNIDGQSFNSPVALISGVQDPFVTATADLDNDGDLDVISASGDGKIVWYENVDGQGTFRNARRITAKASAVSTIFTADLDGDGDLDVLDDNIAWYENLDGKGTFGPQRVISQEATALAAIATDLDGDGDQDVVHANGNFVVGWFENLGGKEFGERQLISNFSRGVQSLKSADVDNDGDMDLVLAESASFAPDRRIDQIVWFENAGDGRFVQAHQVTNELVAPNDATPADVDGDGDIDILSAAFEGDQIAWFENVDSAGTFGPLRSISKQADGAQSVVAADVDGDGDLDAVSASYYDDKIAWYENLDGVGTFGLHERVITLGADGAVDLVTGDLDSDGDADFLSASILDNTLKWYRNDQTEFPLGDFDEDSQITGHDIDRLCLATQHSGDSIFDLNQDGNIDDIDMSFFLDDVARTSIGDVNLDRIFNSRDLVSVFQAAEYDDGELANSTWTEGDWDCNSEFDSRDLVLAFSRGAYISSAIAAALDGSEHLRLSLRHLMVQNGEGKPSFLEFDFRNEFN